MYASPRCRSLSVVRRTTFADSDSAAQREGDSSFRRRRVVFQPQESRCERRPSRHRVETRCATHGPAQSYVSRLWATAHHDCGQGSPECSRPLTLRTVQVTCIDGCGTDLTSTPPAGGNDQRASRRVATVEGGGPRRCTVHLSPARNGAQRRQGTQDLPLASQAAKPLGAARV